MEKTSLSWAALPLAMALSGIIWSQVPQPGRLNLLVIAGDGAINNIKQRTSRETIVQVEDENHKPVAAAAVLFLLPDNGPSGTFANSARSVTVTTGADGRARMPRFQPNQTEGALQINVTASFGGLQATAVISQTNSSTAVVPAHHALATKVIVIIGVAAAAGGVGIWASQHCWSNCTSLTISSGTATLTSH